LRGDRFLVTGLDERLHRPVGAYVPCDRPLVAQLDERRAEVLRPTSTAPGNHADCHPPEQRTKQQYLTSHRSLLPLAPRLVLRRQRESGAVGFSCVSFDRSSIHEPIGCRSTFAYCMPNRRNGRSGLQIQALVPIGMQDALITIEDNWGVNRKAGRREGQRKILLLVGRA